MLEHLHHCPLLDASFGSPDYEPELQVLNSIELASLEGIFGRMIKTQIRVRSFKRRIFLYFSLFFFIFLYFPDYYGERAARKSVDVVDVVDVIESLRPLNFLNLLGLKINDFSRAS